MKKNDPFTGLAATEDEFDLVHEAVLADGELVRYDSTRLTRKARHREKEREDKCTDEPRVEPVDHQDPGSKVHPLLRQWLRERDGDDVETLVVTFRDELEMPRFPEPDIEQPRDCCDNKRELDRAYDAYKMALRLDPEESRAKRRVREMEAAAGLPGAVP